MTAVNPNDTLFSFRIIPRFYPIGSVTLEITSETTKEKTEVLNAYSINNGYLDIGFEFSFTDKEKYSLKIYNEDGVIYRGKIIATEQQPQEYKLTKDLFYYG